MRASSIKLSSCPICDSKKLILYSLSDAKTEKFSGYTVMCTSCKFSSYICKSPKEAICAWEAVCNDPEEFNNLQFQRKRAYWDELDQEEGCIDG